MILTTYMYMYMYNTHSLNDWGHMYKTNSFRHYLSRCLGELDKWCGKDGRRKERGHQQSGAGPHGLHAH